MVTLSIEIEETILQKAQQRALQEGLTLNAVLSYYLNNYAENKERYQQATLKILELAQQSTAASKGSGVSLPRENLWDIHVPKLLADATPILAPTVRRPWTPSHPCCARCRLRTTSTMTLRRVGALT